jgi:hypothetical protein
MKRRAQHLPLSDGYLPRPSLADDAGIVVRRAGMMQPWKNSLANCDRRHAADNAKKIAAQRRTVGKSVEWVVHRQPNPLIFLSICVGL